MTDFGLIVEPSATYTAPLAKRIEAMGFGYFLAPDTQNLCADPYGQLNLAAVATTTLRIGTGVTNPITRDSAVTAGALATMQVESGGRVICGIGRGDSSAAHISLLGGSPVAQPHGPRVTGAVDTMELFAEKVLPVFNS